MADERTTLSDDEILTAVQGVSPRAATADMDEDDADTTDSDEADDADDTDADSDDAD